MKSDRAKELFRIRAARKVGLEQFGRARSEARAKMWKKREMWKKLFRAVRFHSARTGTLATQAIYKITRRLETDQINHGKRERFST